MKKKFFSLFLILFVVIGITGCSFKLELSNSKDSDDSKKKEIDYLVLVNKESKLPSDWEDRVELVEVTNGLGEKYKVEKKTAEAYEKLRKELLDEGITIELDSTYRTVKEQQEIWDEFEAERGLEYAQTYVAVPGTSEHHTGLAIDVKIIKDGVVIDDNDDMTAETEIFGKIHEKLSKYGFILRYPVGKEDITGYGAEVWHFRYVDSTKIAKDIMDKGITFEEYLKN